MNAEELLNWRWLTSDESDPWLQLAANNNGALHQLISQLRKSLTEEQTRCITQQVELRARATVKFSAANEMLFTSKLLEQSTDHSIARYKASRFPADVQVHDICCGIGGDLMALLSRGPVTAIDREEVAILLARHNASVATASHHAPHECSFHQTSVDESTVGELNADWIHIDPDRRPDESPDRGTRATRVTAWEYLAPSSDVLESLRRRAKGLAIKVAPATDAPEQWLDAEREWIGSRGECRQQVVWCGELARAPGRRVATVVDKRGGVHRLEEIVGAELPSGDAFQQYVIEPHPAVLAAELAPTLAQQHSANAIAAHGGYLTGGIAVTSPLAATFEVVDQSPLDPRKVRQMLQNHDVTRLEVKRRGIEETPDKILKRLKWRNISHKTANADKIHTLIVTRLQNQVMTALCRRVERTA